MRALTTIVALGVATACVAADVESRVLTHYLPQDFLETVVRTEDWTAVALVPKGGSGLRKGDTVRVWAGGLIDRGNGDQPGENCNGPDGYAPSEKVTLALAGDPALGYALLFKTESTGPTKCLPPGKPLEIKLTRDAEKVWVGFNDEKGKFRDNHLGKGKRHETDPLWVRVEVVRTVVD
jgi:hypothetical protein